MSKSIKQTSFWGELLAVGIYKRNQGRLVRQLSALAFVLVAAYGAYTLSQGPLADFRSRAVSVGIPILLVGAGAWVSYRLVNYPRFADFLISVEAEMDKVTWPAKSELYRSAVVVISTMVVMGAVLLAYDVFWQWLFRVVGFLHFAAE